MSGWFRFYFFSSLALIFFFGCARPGSVTSERSEAFVEVRQPEDFQSPLQTIKELSEQAKKIQKNKNRNQAESLAYHLAVLTTLEREQIFLEKTLQSQGKIQLLPGRSYSFILKSFCVNAGKERPLHGDGFRLGSMEGSAASWLPLLLEKYEKVGVSQHRAQSLIWALLSGACFQTLSSRQKTDILQIFPDAPARFVSCEIEKKAKSWFRKISPSSVTEAIENLDRFQRISRDSSRTFEEISDILAPSPSRTTPLSMGWVRLPSGVLARAKSVTGYSKIQLDLFVPTFSDPVNFSPTDFIALPVKGQRLAISPYSILENFHQSIQDLLNNVGQSLRDALGNLIAKVFGLPFTKQEKDLIVKHPLDALKISQNTLNLQNFINQNFPELKSQHNNEADAFRHFVWSALNARDLGTQRAREFMEAHEMNSKSPANEREMDLWNNEQGFQAAEHLGKNATLEQIQKEFWKLLREGKLKIIRPDLSPG